MESVDTKFKNEILFSSVEAELAKRWIVHDVPAHFAHRPVNHLHRVVNAWWCIYHESVCAGQVLDRSIWERRVDYPGVALDTPSLLTSLEEIHRLINVEGILSFRPLHSHEVAAICLLANMTAFYAQIFTS